MDEKGKGKYILENVKIGENLYSICGDKYFIEDDIVPIFEDVLNDKIQLNEEENIEYRFHLFLVSMPASIVRALTLTMTNKENIRQQKHKEVSITQLMRNKKDCIVILDSLEQEHINTRTTKLLFPIVILAGGDTNYPEQIHGI